MKFESRQYQQDACDAWWKSLQDSNNNPLIAVPTGAGKSIILGMLIDRYLKEYPDNHVWVLSHTREILKQDFDALLEFLPDRDIAMYSAGLGLKNHGQITVAGIQSIYKNPDLIKWANLIAVDEVHTVNHKAKGMYRALLDGTHAVKIGMSATVYRTGHGLIYNGKEPLFNCLAYDLTSGINIRKLVLDGYLTKLISVETKLQLDSKNVKKSGGDYNLKHLAKEHDRDYITKQAIEEAVYYGKNYKKWLVFAIDIDHADHICKHLISSGIPSGVLHSRISGDRDTVVDDFKNTDKIRALVSVGMVTTGFDAPGIDLILLLRPTLSAVLHVQMLGRGLRVAPNKKHCLVLDYAGNTANLGPIDDVRIPTKKKGDGTGEAPTKTCPKCRTINYAISKQCSSCNYEFPFKVNITNTASTASVMGKSKDTQKWLNVQRVDYAVHSIPGKRASLVLTYTCGNLMKVKEWWCLDHAGFAGRKAAHMARVRGYHGVYSVGQVYANRIKLKIPKRILVDFGPSFPAIINSQL